MNPRTLVSPLFRSLSVVLFAVAVALPAVAQEPVTVRVVPQKEAVRAGERLVIAVVLEHAEGYHTWPSAVVVLPEAVAEFAIRTEVEVKGKPGWADRIDPVQWPKASPAAVADPTGEAETIEVPLYSHRAVAYIGLRVSPAAGAGPQSLMVRVAFQACDDRSCAQPQDMEVPVSVMVAATGAAEGKQIEPELFAGYVPGEARATPPATGPPAAEAGAMPPAPAQTIFGYSFSGGLIVVFLVAILGGFVLNLTPCVLPVIPIKVMTLTQHAGSPKRAMVLGLWMALGVVAFWVAAGLPMVVFSRTAGDPSRLIFGTWWVTLSIGLVIAAMGLGIMGLFTLNLPQSVYLINPKADTARGSFMFGVMTAVLGLPCFGFVAGGLLAGAATLPWVTIMIVFTGLGVGMAAPYLILSARPSLLNFVPRTGPASNLVKQVMGLFLLAAAAFFVAGGISGLIADKPYLSHTINWWVVAFFVTVASLWLIVRTLQISRAVWPRVVMPLFAAVFMAAAILFAGVQTGTARESYLRQQEALAEGGGGGDDGLVAGAWLPYTPERVAKARAADNVVLVDFTANWCIICKSWKARYLDTDPVRARLRELNAILIEADTTSKNSAASKYLQELGQTGVPTIAVFGPALKEPIIFNAYTSETVMNALNAAAGEKGTALRGP